MSLSAANFPSFFTELHSTAKRTVTPFPWQTELARRACAGAWPAFIAVPTGSGKTAALDAAVFALAIQATLPPEQRTAPRRIFYIVNRRIIVDEAFARARKIADALTSPSTTQPTVARVAAALKTLSPDTTLPPLDHVQLRGGIYRETLWARSATQPLIISATTDQIGSRLLFRGYGVSASAWPIHAALVANDSLILLDEAHISRPFAQTLAAVARYHRVSTPANTPPATPPFTFVQMTATPPADTDATQVLPLSAADLTHPILSLRLHAPKPTHLIIAQNAHGKNALPELAKTLATEAEKLLTTPATPSQTPRSLAVLVNRVATAREVFSLLQKKHPTRATLLIGRMRPLDRDELTHHLQAELRTDTTISEHTEPDAPRIVVATQCLEVGADFDFDALVTECASLDALRQRFGRLNRAGRPIPAHATIVIRADQTEQNDDPIYGPALSHTWNWLNEKATTNESPHPPTIDFGLSGPIVAHPASTTPHLLSPTTDAPILLPAHLDALCQTAPEPTPQPDIALFLHGTQRPAADIQICWRSDLPLDSATSWPDILALAPPLSLETLPVPLWQFHQWFLGEPTPDTNDLLEAPATSSLPLSPPTTGVNERNQQAPALVWRGPEKSFPLTAANLSHLHPGDTIVLASSTPRSTELGHIPTLSATAPIPDHAERAYATARRRHLLRLPPALLSTLAHLDLNEQAAPSLAALLAFATSVENDIRRSDLSTILHAAANEAQALATISPALHAALLPFAAAPIPPKHLRIARYPGGTGIVLTAPLSIPTAPSAAPPLTLARHLADVLAALRRSLDKLPPLPFRTALETAAAAHDWGKADERFQALLLGGGPDLAWAQNTLLAKSATTPDTRAEHEAARHRATLPSGFRHEFLSVQLLETALSATAHTAAPASLAHALALHLVAAHHGHARPFAPIVADPTPPPIELPPDIAESLSAILATPTSANTANHPLTAAARLAAPPHRLDSGVAERFWLLTRHLGWWHLAYLETLLRLADWEASSTETP